MAISLILAHPAPDSFNHALAATAAAELRRFGHAVNFHDLHAEGFDPLLPAAERGRDAELPPLVRRHCDELAAADGVVIVHPNWWGQPPAILKGWIDRVVRPGVAYEFLEGDNGEGVPRGLLKAKTVLVLNTSNTASLREREVFGDPLELIWRNCVFDLCGVSCFRRRMFNIVVTSSEAERQAWLKETRQLVAECFPRP